MNFFTNLFGDKKKEKEKESKDKDKGKGGSKQQKLPQLNAKSTEEQRLAHEVARLFASIEMPALSIPQLADFFELFNSIVSGGENLQVKWNSVRKTRDLCAKLIQPNATLSTIALEGFHPSFQIEGFLEGVLAEPLPLRARHTLALHRFCTVLSHQFEEESMSTPNGFLAGVGNPNITHPQRAPLPPQQAIKIEAPASLDLKNIYLRLLEGTSYLPTAEELHEIIRRTTELLRQERNIVMVSLPAVIVGDIHGQIRDLLYHVIANGGPLVHESVLNDYRPNASGGAGNPNANKGRSEKSTTYLFLGDYVDRGPNSLQCLCLLYVAKLLSPRTVFLLRGNHECSFTNRHYGFLAECHTVYPIVNGRVTTSNSAITGAEDAPESSKFGGMDFDLREHPIWTASNESFKCLPLAAAIFREFFDPPLPPPRANNSKPNGFGPPPPNTPPGTTNNQTKKKQIIAVAMHGGISPFIENSIDGILAINRFREISTGALADITWSDPLPGGLPKRGSTAELQMMAMSSITSLPGDSSVRETTTEELRNVDFSKPAVYNGPPIGYIFSARGTGHNFGEDASCKFINSNKLYFIIRAHQCVQEGYKWVHQNRVLTVFSAPNYCGLGNKGAILLLDKDGKPSTVQYQMKEDPKAKIPVPRPPQNFR